jgi:hypothetical protein
VKLDEIMAAFTVVSLKAWPGKGKKKHSGVDQIVTMDPIKNKLIVPPHSKAKKFFKS